MTDVLVTIDTELSLALHQQGVGVDDNIASSIFGRVGGGAYGIGWQMERMEAHGITGVFFVDPAPALLHGDAVVRRIVEPIVARGHEVQLHIHTEWLAWADTPLVGGRQGRNIGDFAFDDQRALLGWAVDALERAGAPRPIAFRAGNYGADDRTLAALAALGLAWDSSFNAAYLGDGCGIALDPGTIAPVRRHGVVELPVAGLFDRGDHVRPAQVCALSEWEMAAALGHAAETDAPPFAIVCHSFELLSRDRRRPNHAVAGRFAAMCAAIGADPRLAGVGFAALDPGIADAPHDARRLAPNMVRTAARIAAQGIATLRYERA